jgi:hypothetical protein
MQLHCTMLPILVPRQLLNYLSYMEVYDDELYMITLLRSMHYIVGLCKYPCCCILAANPYLRNDYGETALELARRKGHLYVVWAIEVDSPLSSYFVLTMPMTLYSF